MILAYDNVRYFLNKTNPGTYGSRNIGISKSTGEIISLLDNDTFEPDKM